MRASVRRSVVLMLLSALNLSACTDAPSSAPIPLALISDARIKGMPVIRQWGEATLIPAIDRHVLPAGPPKAGASGPMNVLALSAGGENGAFGAGFMTGWTLTGGRPRFHVVTGVSIGALLAPMAFLGADYDAVMARMLTELSGKYQVTPRPRFLALFGFSLASPLPLKKLIAEYFDKRLMVEIAAEHRAGRRLYIGTSHVYAGRLTIWDMGALANSASPDALALFQRILLAAVAVPTLLPPVYFDVEAKGQTYHEMHIDGGIMRQVFVAPPGFDWVQAADRLGTNGELNFFVIRNGRVQSEYMVMPPDVLSLTEHAMFQLTQSLGIGDLQSLYLRAQYEHAQFHAVWIEDGFKIVTTQLYDPAYVDALFEQGWAQARSANAWHRSPPGIVDR